MEKLSHRIRWQGDGVGIARTVTRPVACGRSSVSSIRESRCRVQVASLEDIWAGWCIFSTLSARLVSTLALGNSRPLGFHVVIIFNLHRNLSSAASLHLQPCSAFSGFVFSRGPGRAVSLCHYQLVYTIIFCGNVNRDFDCRWSLVIFVRRLQMGLERCLDGAVR